MEILTTENIVPRKYIHLPVSLLSRDLVMMDMENGTYPNLNRTGSIIRELVKNPVRVEDIVRNLMARFSIDEGTCTSEMINFLSKIANQEALMLEQGRNEFCIK